MMAPAPGHPTEMTIRADVEVPERKLAMTWLLRRNTNQDLPITHTMEVMFSMPADSPFGGIKSVPGMLMRQAERARGEPLFGSSIKVTPTSFLIGLSGLESDAQHNLELLSERSWLDIPVFYGNGRRAIIAMEKGASGERAFTEAFKAWGQSKKQPAQPAIATIQPEGSASPHSRFTTSIIRYTRHPFCPRLSNLVSCSRLSNLVRRLLVAVRRTTSSTGRCLPSRRPRTPSCSTRRILTIRRASVCSARRCGAPK